MGAERVEGAVEGREPLEWLKHVGGLPIGKTQNPGNPAAGFQGSGMHGIRGPRSRTDQRSCRVFGLVGLRRAPWGGELGRNLPP